MPLLETPLHVFRFHVDFMTVSLNNASPGQMTPVCSGSFAECTGLEATMEPKVIKEGGLNYGAHQRAGTVTFGTVVLKRGYSSTRDLWNWFQSVAGGAYAQRMSVIINIFDLDGSVVFAWQLDRALPIKFKAADLNAKSQELGIEELHLAHEGLSIAQTPSMTSLTA